MSWRSPGDRGVPLFGPAGIDAGPKGRLAQERAPGAGHSPKGAGQLGLGELQRQPFKPGSKRSRKDREAVCFSSSRGKESRRRGLNSVPPKTTLKS